MTIPPVLLVGCGRMGSAMLAGWREQGLAPSVVVDPAPAADFAGAEVAVVKTAEAVPAHFAPAAVVLAVKPQNAAEALPLYRRFAADRCSCLSWPGGRSRECAALLGEARIVRAMPNTPAAIRQGITVFCPGPGVHGAEAALCEQLLGAIGEVARVEDEALLDPVTAVSGSGPAYVFLLAELLEQAARGQGIPPDLARRLARRTVAGSGALLAASAEDAAALRRAVTSPGGTTERALGVLMAAEAWPRNLDEAIAAATARSRELAG